MPAAERLPRARVRQRRQRRRGLLHPRRARLADRHASGRHDRSPAPSARPLEQRLARRGDGPIMPRSRAPCRARRHRQVLAAQGGLRLFVPIEQERITAIAYHQVAGSRAFSLEPVRPPGQRRPRPQAWRASSATAPAACATSSRDNSTDAVDVGARSGTRIYAPVDGLIASVTPEVIGGVTPAVTVGISPTDDPSVVVYVGHVTSDAATSGDALRVGDSVPPRDPARHRRRPVEGRDLRSSQVRLGQGNNATGRVDPAPTLAIP